jgi:hypothetical protein
MNVAAAIHRPTRFRSDNLLKSLLSALDRAARAYDIQMEAHGPIPRARSANLNA